ncbi:MAG: hypothetical protein HYX94_10615, partial [Chloroflexi bacterium]|nr:hypothetical protein [Chloroflexota bacterium]
MKDLKARTVVASEYPELRYSLTRVVQDELGGTVVAEAENVIRAVALARTLRPDLVVVDDRLPHVVGVDGVPLSRIGGLDAALSVVQELPRARALLVSHNGAALAPNNKGEGRKELYLYQRATPVGGPLDQRLTFA